MAHCWSTDKVQGFEEALGDKIPGFAVQGLRDVTFELYPNGTNQSADSKAVLRICMPPGASVKYQCWLGKTTGGSAQYESGGSLTVDVVFDSWKDQVAEDGSLIITMEILKDLTNCDESLARAVLMET